MQIDIGSCCQIGMLRQGRRCLIRNRKAAGSASKADAAKYVDKISSDEDVRMNARLKNICHGC
jgi:hypothetical protein